MSGLINKMKNMMLGTVNDDEYEDEYEEMEPVREFYDLPRDRYSHDRDRDRDRERDVMDIPTTRGGKRASAPHNVVNFQASVQMQVVLTYPNSVQEATAICDYIKENKTCIVNLEGVDRNNAQRIADFLGGASYALNGEIQRVSNEIFIIAPANVHLSGELKEELKANGIVLPWITQAFK